MKFACTILLVGLLADRLSAQTTLFQQDFSAGSSTSTYVDAANPGTSKFTEIGVSTGTNATPTVSIVNGAVELSRLTANTGGGQCRLVRNTDLSTTAQCLYVQFTVDISTGGASAWAVADNMAFMNIGDGSSYANGGTEPFNTQTFGKLFFSIGSASQQLTWTVAKRVNNTSTNATTFFQGQHQITWVLNKSDYRYTYLLPSGSGTSTVASGKWDVWVDNTLIFDEVPATTVNVDLRKFKFIFDGAIGTVRLDNFLIRDVAGSLPVTLVQFAGKAQGPQVDLTWTTTGEHDSDMFTVERSADALAFEAVGTVQASGETTSSRTYGFSDKLPLSGPNYYRLRQIDRDGSSTLSKLIAVRYEPDQPALLVLDNPASGDQIRVRAYVLDNPTYALTTLTGAPVPCLQRETPGGEVTLLPQHPLLPGVYFLSAVSGLRQLTRRVLVR